MNKPKFKRPWILLHPEIPKPMHGINPRTVKGDDWWNKTRQKAYAENNFCCWSCGINKLATKQKWLEAHECYHINYRKGLMKMIYVVALCHDCHSYIHGGRLTMLLQEGKISQVEFDGIVRHGKNLVDNLEYLDRDLANRQFKTPLLDDDEKPEWGDWRMEIDGKLYEPLHKSFEEWRKFYSGDAPQNTSVDFNSIG